MNRRGFLKAVGLGASAVLLAGSGTAGWRAHQAGLLWPDERPFAPWEALRSASVHDPAALAAAAILASNPHNTQPWRLSVDRRHLVLLADAERHLGAFDPYRREMWIGLGCALANAEVAAPGFGFATEAPEVSGRVDGSGMIRMDITEQAPEEHPLASVLSLRRTNRGNYETTPIADETISAVLAQTGQIQGARVVFIDRKTAKGAALAEATLKGTMAINADKQMSSDGHLWFRGNARKVALYRDGVSVPTAGLSPLTSVMGQILPEADAETSGSYWLASTRRQVQNCGGFGLIMVDDLDGRSGQIAAGRLWQRLHLSLTLQGLAGQPMNQLPELVDRDRQLRRNGRWNDVLTEIAGMDGLVTFVFRYGVPKSEVPHSARRPLHWVARQGV